MKSQDSRGGFNRDLSKVTGRLTNPPGDNLGDKRKTEAEVQRCNQDKFIASRLLPLASILLPLTSCLLLTPVRAGLPNIPMNQQSTGGFNRYSYKTIDNLDKPALTTNSPLTTPTAKSRSCQAQDIKTLTTGLLQALPGYANRVSQRARRLSRSSDVYSYVILAGRPEFEPLTLGPGAYTSKSQLTDSQPVQQVFFTTLERQYTKGKAIELQQFNWVFLTKSQSGWRLATMFSQIGGYPAQKPPTPPKDSSNGIIAQAINAWLRDCQAESSP